MTLIEAIMYLASLGFFWATILTYIAYHLEKVGKIVPVTLFILFIVVTVILAIYEVRSAPDVDELLGHNDEPKQYPELHPEHLYEPDEDNDN